jgi:hypothetical protein
MTAEDLKKIYGEEYPSSVVMEGTRMLLVDERRFSRDYETPKSEIKTAKCYGTTISRFRDGSASMTAEQLRREWPTWTRWERWDFCHACCWLNKQGDYPEMLRFIMHHCTPDDWPEVAIRIAVALPAEETFPFLIGALEGREAGKCANIIQAIAHTKHPEAAAVVRKQLEIDWQHPDLWKDDDFLNWIACEARCCIEYLIELGDSPADFGEKVRKLSEHVCPHNRDDCRRWLSKHYSWLN